MGRPVPEDDNAEVQQLSAEEIAAHEAGTEAGDEQEVEGTEATEVTEESEGEETEEQFSESGLEAILNDGERGIPASRLSEVVADRDAARRDADIARQLAEQLLAERAAGTSSTTRKEDAAVVRDFAAELKSLREKYKAGDLDDDQYDDARNALILEQAEDRVTKTIAPKMQALETEVANTRREKAQAAINAAAAPLIKKYPFLDIGDEAGRNMEAIGKVQAVRDELVRTGVPFIRAMQLAVAEVAPEYASQSRAVVEDAEEEGSGEGTVDSEKVTQIRNTRAQQGRAAAVKAANQTPPSTSAAGVSDGAPPTKQVLTRSVEDAEKWDKMTPQQRKAAVIPQ
jgi:hypothetical protein